MRQPRNWERRLHSLALSPITMAFQAHRIRGQSPVTDAQLMPGEAAFVAALDRIATSHREPTAWEAECLYAALCAMAVGDHRTAERKVALCALGDTGLPSLVRVLPPLTVDDLRDALVRLERPDGQVMTPSFQRGRFAGPALAIVALLATFVMLHP